MAARKKPEAEKLATKLAYHERTRAQRLEGMKEYRINNLDRIKANQKLYADKHKDRIRAMNKAHIEANPDMALGWWLKKFGITAADYHRMEAEQGGKCAIPGCGGTGSIKGGRLCVDHNHETGKVRGLLCGHCNLILGHAKDSPERLEAAAKWLREEGWKKV